MRLPVLGLLLLILLSVSQSSCRKWYCCQFPSGQYICYKDSITVTYFSVDGTTQNYQQLANDSINYYKNLGYSCSLYMQRDAGHCILGEKGRKQAVAGGEECDDGQGGGWCSADLWCGD